MVSWIPQELMAKFLVLIGFAAVGVACLSTEPADLEILFEAPDFSLQNCSGEDLSNDDLLGSIWVVDFIFTRCGGPCPLMTQRMRSLQKSLVQEGLLSPPFSVKLVSISVDPAYDTPEILKEYADNWEADLESWYFLTGPLDSTLELIGEGFKIAAAPENSGVSEGEMEMPNIIHSTHFLLVDQRGRIRSIYHLDDPHLKERIIEGILFLGNIDPQNREG